MMLAPDMTTDQALRYAKAISKLFGGRPKPRPWKERKSKERSK
jgi:hypothetical protein